MNEPIDYSGVLRSNLFSDVLGRDYIDVALQAARAADPTARLFINEFDTEGLSPKSNGLHSLVSSLLADGVPLDGVGFQFHVTTNVPSVAEMIENFQRFASLGLEIHITEMDVRIPRPATESNIDAQAATYQAITDACRAVPACTSITTWGLTDKYSWVPSHYEGYGAALPFDRLYQAKPAWFGIARSLGLDALETSTREAEEAQTRTSGTALAGNWRLTTNGVVGDGFFVRNPGPTLLTVAASGTSGGGRFPFLDVAVDGTVVGTIHVDSESTRSFSLQTSMTRGPHQVELRFNDDYYAGPGDDRNVAVDRFGLGNSVVAQEFVNRSDGQAAEGGWQLAQNGQISHPLGVAVLGRVTLLIQAKGTSAADQGPIIEVRLDGTPIAHTTVRSENWEYYEVEFTVERGRAELALVYVNNAELDQASDRNLYLGRVLVAGS